MSILAKSPDLILRAAEGGVSKGEVAKRTNLEYDDVPTATCHPALPRHTAPSTRWLQVFRGGGVVKDALRAPAQPVADP